MNGAGRVIAGSARGIRLLSPGEGTRPLADRVKETLFAILEPDLPDAKMLDLFAGSGAGGIEALSRGAAQAVFVDKDRAACRTIGENLARTRLAERGVIVQEDTMSYLLGRMPADGPFDVVLADPPYANTEWLQEILRILGTPPASGKPPILTPEAWVVAKHPWRKAPPPADGLLASVRTRRFGETVLTFYRPIAEPGA